MEIYRIEHATAMSAGSSIFRAGPYGNGGVARIAPPARWDRHPLLDTETGLEPSPDWHFGFRDLGQLRAWFNRRERRHLRRGNFVCRVYDGRGFATEKQAVLTGRPCEIRTLKASEWVE